MKHVYIKALMLLDNRIKSCGKALSKATDAESLTYWKLELQKAQSKRFLIMRRSRIQHNVVYVDFVNRKKAA